MLTKPQFKRMIHKGIEEKDAFERRMLLDSKWEEVLFDELRFLKFMPETQFPVGPYFIDLAYPENKIGIEIDSDWWHKDLEYDLKRQDFLEKRGWKIIRIRGEDIKECAEKMAIGIISQLKSNGCNGRFIDIDRENVSMWEGEEEDEEISLY